LSEKNREIKKSKAAAQSLFNQIKYHRDEKLFGSCEPIENHLKICRKNKKLLKEKKSTEEMFQDEPSQKYLENMLKKWDLIEDKLQEMLQWCLEYKAMTKNITAMKDELKKLKDVDSIKRKHLKSKQGLDKCKRSLSRLAQLKDDLFHLNLHVHHLISLARNNQNITLLYQCKEEVITLYKDWEDAHEKVSEADKEYLKLSYVEATYKCMSDALVKKNHEKKQLHINDLELGDQLERLQKMLDDLKDKIVTKDIKTIANQRNSKPNVTHNSRLIYLVPRLSLISSLAIMLVMSLSWLATPQCCDYQATWQLWSHTWYRHHPPPI